MASKKLQIADLRIGDSLVAYGGIRHPMNGNYQVRGFIDGNVIIRSIRNNKPFWEILTSERLEELSEYIKWKRLKS